MTRTIPIDEDALTYLCVEVCTRRQSRCPACKLYMAVHATQFMRTMNVPAVQAVDLVVDAAAQVGTIGGDDNERFRILGDANALSEW